MTNEVKVGILFFVALGILFLLTVVIAEVSFIRVGYGFSVQFDDVMGLEKGNKVLVSGVAVGRVKDIKIEKDMVVVHCWIDDERIFISSDSKVTVEQSSLLAGMQLSITLGQSQVSIRHMPPKKGERPINFTKSLGQLSDELRKIVETVKKDFSDTLVSVRESAERVRSGPGTVHDLLYSETIYQNIEETTKRLKNISTEMDEGKGTVGKLLKDEKVYEDAKKTLEELRQAAANAREITESVKKGEGTVGKLFKDEGLYQDLRETVSGAKSTISTLDEGLKGEGLLAQLLSDRSAKIYEDVESSAASIRKVSEQIASRKGAFSRFLFEDEVYEYVKGLAKSLRKSAEKVENALEKGDNTISKLLTESKLYDNANKAMEAVDKSLGPAARLRIDVSLGEFYSEALDQNTTKLALKLYPHEARYFLLGLTLFHWDDKSMITFDQEKQDKGYPVTEVDFQLAFLFKLSGGEDTNPNNDVTLTLRAGLMEGRAGGGTDVDFLKDFRFTVEGRDTHSDPDRFYEPMEPFLLRSYLSMRVYKYFRIYAGADNVLDDCDFGAGLVLEWTDEDIKSIVGIAGSVK
jgi:phospholipid/cholesterol/gamma-HCH transport system substrate-binding protein